MFLAVSPSASWPPRSACSPPGSHCQSSQYGHPPGTQVLTSYVNATRLDVILLIHKCRHFVVTKVIAVGLGIVLCCHLTTVGKASSFQGSHLCIPSRAFIEYKGQSSGPIVGQSSSGLIVRAEIGSYSRTGIGSFSRAVIGSYSWGAVIGSFSRAVIGS